MGQYIGDYEVRGEIGRGGFGRVFLGFDPRVERLVAIKVMTADAEEGMVDRFRIEAAAAGNLHHRNIVTVHEYGEDQGRHYLVMEYLKGQDLQKIIKEKQTLTILQKVDIMSQVAEGLICAHRNGVVHRDVKPANIMVLTSGEVKILDFGIARVQREGGVRLTQKGFLVGTVSYMAPELLGGGDFDALCDIWAFGAIYYELLTGQHPFHGSEVGSIMYKIASASPPALSSLCGDCPLTLDRVIARLLAKDRDDRYQNLEDVQFDIAPVLRDLQRKQAAQFFRESQALLKDGRLDDASSTLRKSLDLDPANEETRRLREVIQEQMRQRVLRPRIAGLLKQAEQDVDRRSYADAIRKIDSALRLAPADAAIREYRDEVEAEWRQVEEASRLTEQAREQLDLRDLTGAQEIVNSALALDHANPEATALLTRIHIEREWREQERQFRSALKDAEILLATSALYDASELLSRLRLEHPESLEVAELLARLSRQQEEQARRTHLQTEMAACQALMRGSDLKAAIELLNKVVAEFPAEDQPQGLLLLAQSELRTRERDEACKDIGHAALQLVEQTDFLGALAQLEDGLRAYPGEPRLLELQRAISTSREEYEKARALKDQIVRCRELRLEGRLDEAWAFLETLRGAYPESEGWVAERDITAHLIQNRGRERALSQAIERGTDLLESGHPDSAIHLLEGAIASIGDEPSLREILDRATEAQRQIERARDISERTLRAREHEAAGEWDAALALIQQGADLYGPVVEFHEIAGRVAVQKNIHELRERINRCIQGREWAPATVALEDARAAYPEESCWEELDGRILAGSLKQNIEQSLARGELDRARLQLEEARRTKARVTRIEVLESELERASTRRDRLSRARNLMAAGNHAQAEHLLREQFQEYANDPETVSLLGVVRRCREEQEREGRRNLGRAQAERLVDEKRFDEAVRVLKGLLKEFRTDAALHEDLLKAKEAKDNAEREARYHDGRTESSQLASRGEFEAATHILRKLLKQFPGDADLERDLAASAAAWEKQRKDHQDSANQRRVESLIQERRFDAALELLRPLLREHPEDLNLQESWRTAITGKQTSSDWLDQYQRVAELEALYQKGKAAAVKEKAQRLLNEKEEPRARQLLSWAEAALATQSARPRSSRFSIQSRADWIAIAAAVLALLGIVIWMLVR